MKSLGSTGDISAGVSSGVGGLGAPFEDVDVGREGDAQGRAMGIGIVRDSRFELRDAPDSDLMERVSMTLSSSDRGGTAGAPSDVRGWSALLPACPLTPHWGTARSGMRAGASMASWRLLWRSTICCERREASLRRRGAICDLAGGENERDVFCREDGQ